MEKYKKLSLYIYHFENVTEIQRQGYLLRAKNADDVNQ